MKKNLIPLAILGAVGVVILYAAHKAKAASTLKPAPVLGGLFNQPFFGLVRPTDPLATNP